MNLDSWDDHVMIKAFNAAIQNHPLFKPEQLVKNQFEQESVGTLLKSNFISENTANVKDLPQENHLISSCSESNHHEKKNREGFHKATEKQNSQELLETSDNVINSESSQKLNNNVVHNITSGSKSRKRKINCDIPPNTDNTASKLQETKDKDFASLLSAWYYAGYHAGRYEALYGSILANNFPNPIHTKEDS